MFLTVLQRRSSAASVTWRLPQGTVARVLAAVSVMGVVTYLVVSLVGAAGDTRLWNLATVLAGAGAGLLVYGLALIALGELSPRQWAGGGAPAGPLAAGAATRPGTGEL